jgi:hypothetical protein
MPLSTVEVGTDVMSAPSLGVSAAPATVVTGAGIYLPPMVGPRAERWISGSPTGSHFDVKPVGPRAAATIGSNAELAVLNGRPIKSYVAAAPTRKDLQGLRA